MKIRLANRKDLIQINEIYNQSIPSKSSTADLDPITIEERQKWFKQHNNYKYPVFVAELGDKISGWISLSPYRPGRMALQYTAEVSYYIHQDYQSKGIGIKLLDFVINNSYKYQIKNLIAILLEHNVPSIKLLEKFGFEKWGLMPDIVNFSGEEYGHLYYGLRINNENRPEIRLAKTTDDFNIGKELFIAYAKSLDFNLCFQNFEDELNNIESQYSKPFGGLILLSLKNKNIGCVGIRKFDYSICELKRMYIIKHYRNKGYGRLILNAAIQFAITLHYKKVRLDTLTNMGAAIKLYEELGFCEIKSYRYNPVEGAKYYEFILVE